jgi:hypothetical protein
MIDPSHVTVSTTVEIIAPPLNGTALVATLNAVLGLWTLQQAANIAQLPEETLVKEAEAWAAAGGTP